MADALCQAFHQSYEPNPVSLSPVIEAMSMKSATLLAVIAAAPVAADKSALTHHSHADQRHTGCKVAAGWEQKLLAQQAGGIWSP